MNTISFTKVDLPYGWLGNMSPYPVEYEGVFYKTTEALFQCLRFYKYPRVQTEIRQQKSPMSAKMVAKKHKQFIAIDEHSDIDRMTLCLEVKINQHPQLKGMLSDTDDAVIIEDCSSRPHGSGKFWGAAFIQNKWVGRNVLGNLWMTLRNKI